MSDNSEDISRFMSFTNVSFNVAKEYLDNYGGDLNAAMEAYYEDQKDIVQEKRDQERAHMVPRPQVTHSSSSTRTSSRDVSRTNSNSRFMSFSDMVRSNADKEDEENEGKPRNTFAGGETSGLEVTDPTGDDGYGGRRDANSLIRDLLEKAQRQGEQMEEDANDSASPHFNSKQQQQQKHVFTGKGYRLGSMVDKPSEVVEDFSTNSNDNSGSEKVTREITFWKEGFQVGEGKLYRYDDPANAFFLNELNQGRAPLKLLNVEFGQEVEVNVFKKLDESYKPPKRKLGGFEGKGQRLGSPIPGERVTPASTTITTAPTTTTTTDSRESNEKGDKEQEQSSHGGITIQIRYATGKREVYHCNSTDKVSSLYEHVRMNMDSNETRDFTLNHAFPVKPIKEMDKTLQDADLKNSVVVQRWV